MPFEQFFYWFGNHYFLGIRLDIIAHFSISALIGWGLLYHGKWKPMNVMALMIVISLLKELVIDWRPLRYNHLYDEAIQDVIFNWLGLGFGWIVAEMMGKNDE